MSQKNNTLGEVKLTPRGFEIIEFQDIYLDRCKLQQSSLAEYEKPGTSAVWVGTQDGSMHLNRQQVSALIFHLTNWLKKGTFKGDSNE